MNNQERRNRRIREISQEINRLSEELQQILQVETTNRPADLRPALQRENANTEEVFQVGDQVRVLNRYVGRFGATKGSTGTVTGIEENYIYFRLDRNGSIVHRHRRNLALIHRVEENVVEQYIRTTGAKWSTRRSACSKKNQTKS